MHDAQVNLADGGFVVVNQPYAALAKGSIDDDLLIQLAAHALSIGNRVGRDLILHRNVAADANTPFAMQPAFAHTFATSVLEQMLATAGIAVAKNRIRDQLL